MVTRFFVLPDHLIVRNIDSCAAVVSSTSDPKHARTRDPKHTFITIEGHVAHAPLLSPIRFR